MYFRKILLASAFFCCALSPVSADQLWNKEIETSGQFAQIDDSFDAVSFEFSEEWSAEYFDGNWKTIEKDDENNPFSRFSNIILWGKDEPFLMRFSGDVPEEITAHFQRIEMVSTVLPRYASLSVGGISVISREEWGADESIRYNGEHKGMDVEEKESGNAAANARAAACTDAQDVFPDEFELEKIVKTENGNNLIWPYQYSKKIRKIVVHHTAETGAQKGLTGEQITRSIYNYHAVSRGWGDIGYHYLISADGRIFEGRAGGDRVVAGHVYCNNIGTIGISLMGNFEENDPTPAQIAALERFLPALAKKYGLDLTDTEYFHGKKTSNLIGHRDLAATACPGKNLYASLPTIRKYLGGTAEIQFTKTLKVDGEPVGSPEVLKLTPGRSADITLAFKNTGNATWNANTWLFANPGEGITLESASPNGTRYFAARMKEKSISPGEVAHFDVHLKAEYMGGIYTVSFVPIVDDRRLSNAETLQVIEVESSDFGGRLSEFKTEPKVIPVGASISIAVDMKNTGKTRWTKDRVSLRLKELGGKTEITLPLKKSTSSGANGTFLGRIPAFSSTGEKTFFGELFVEDRKIGTPFSQKLNVTTSETKAKNVEIKKKVLFLNIQKFSEKIRFQNAGTVTWEQASLSLEIRNGRDLTKLKPQEKTIEPSSEASFQLDIGVSNRLTPYFFTLRDGTRILEKKLVLMKNTGEAIVTTTPTKIESSKKTKEKVVAPSKEKNIRIRLSFPFEQFAEMSGNFSVLTLDGERIFSGKKIKLEKFGEKIRWGNRTFEALRVTPKDSNPLEILNWDRFPAWDTARKWNDNQFSGILEIRVFEGKLVIVNELPLEDYLAGVAEVPEGEPFEKKKALAVAARSYAEFYMDSKNEKFPGAPFDGSDDPNEFQKYLGANFTARAPEWRKAVSETTDEVLTFKNELIKPPYHSCSGGRTLSAEEKWGWTNTPYLISVEDPGGVGKTLSGHGVGLSGCGSKYFADQGKTYREILDYYYPGTEIEKK